MASSRKKPERASYWYDSTNTVLVKEQDFVQYHRLSGAWVSQGSKLQTNASGNFEFWRDNDGTYYQYDSSDDSITALVRSYTCNPDSYTDRDNIFDAGEWTQPIIWDDDHPTVAAYSALASAIVGGDWSDMTGSSLAHVVDPDDAGNKCLRFITVPTALGTTKCMLEKKDVCFVLGDDVWIQYRIRISSTPGNRPHYIADVKTNEHTDGPGVRVNLSGPTTRYPQLEMKYGSKPKYEQTGSGLSLDTWYTIKQRFFLHPREGRVQIWLDGTEILDAKDCWTLPTFDHVYTKLQWGNTSSPDDNTIHVDNYQIQTTPI